MAVNDDILDAQVSHAVGLQRLSTSILRRILALLNRTDADLEDQIRQRLANVQPGTIETEFTTERLQALLQGIRTTNAAVYDQIQVVLLQEALGLAQYEAEFQTKIITEAMPVKLDVAQPTVEQLQAIVLKRPFQGRILREWAKGLEEGRSAKVNDAIRIGMVEGETTDQIVRRVRGTKAMGFKDGVLEISRREAEAVVRTAVTHIANGASEVVYEKNADIISGVRWVSVLDSRTTAVCRARDGQVYKPGKGPRPPAHWNCRSTTTPVTKSFRDLGIDIDEVPQGTRASMNGQVPADMTYGQWLAKQPASMQDDILGATKGKLFRDGGLTVDRFVDRKGSEYTLDELRRREAGAFRKAKLDLESEGAGGKPTGKSIPPLTETPEWSKATTKAQKEEVAAAWVRKGQKLGGTEHAVVMTEDGGLLYAGTSGLGYQVGIPPTEPGVDIVIHHSHPGELSLSPGDFNVAWHRTRQSEARAYTPKGSAFSGRSLVDPKDWVTGRLDATDLLASELRVLGRRDGRDYTYLAPHLVNAEMGKLGLVWYKADLSQEALSDLKRLASDLPSLRAAARAEFKGDA